MDGRNIGERNRIEKGGLTVDPWDVAIVIIVVAVKVCVAVTALAKMAPRRVNHLSRLFDKNRLLLLSVAENIATDKRIFVVVVVLRTSPSTIWL